MEFLDETYSLSEVVAEVGRLILFALGAAGWTYFMILLLVD